VNAVSVPLVAVAHGSRDPRSAAAVRALVARISTEAPGLDVRVSFLDLSEPRVTDVLRGLHAEGHREAIVVPLLLGSAYHARVDLPSLVDGVTAECPGLNVSISDVLGTGLETVALERIAESGADLHDPRLGIVLAAVGSSNAGANAAVASLASRWQTRLGIPVTPALASASKPDVSSAIAKLRAHGARRFAVASWFLAPGLLPDRIAALAHAAAPDALLAAPLADHPGVVDVVLRRYDTTLTSRAATA
jgi:sirohydrochlorin ferrochelatase